MKKITILLILIIIVVFSAFYVKSKYSNPPEKLIKNSTEQNSLENNKYSSENLSFFYNLKFDTLSVKYPDKSEMVRMQPKGQPLNNFKDSFEVKYVPSTASNEGEFVGTQTYGENKYMVYKVNGSYTFCLKKRDVSVFVDKLDETVMSSLVVKN